MNEQINPEALAASRRELMKSISEQDYMLWRHNPITAGYLQYLSDLIGFYRDAAADLVEARMLKEGDTRVDYDPDALSGQLFMLRQLSGLELKTIHGFYGKELPEEDET